MNPIGSPTGLQKGRGGFLRSTDDAPWVTDPTAVTNHNGNKPELIALCVVRGIAVPAKVTVAQLHELLGKRPCRVKYGSPSNAGLVIEPGGGLLKYKQRYSLLGFGIDPSLIDDCKQLIDLDFESEEFNRIADGVMARAERVADGMLAADRGTHGHLLCEMWDRGEPWIRIEEQGEALGLSYDTQLDVSVAWQFLLADNGLEILAVEAACVDDKWRLAGTLDRIVRTTRPLTFVKPDGELVVIPANTVLILDIKFGQVRRAHLIQIASYAQSVAYDTTTETRAAWEWPINQTHALIAHGDFGDDTRPVTIELVWVDLAAGRDHGGRCMADAKLWSARDDLWSVAQIVEGEEPTREEAIGTNVAVLPSPSTPVFAATADDLRVAATAGEGLADTSPATFTVNDLLPRQGMPQHALDEIEVDRLNEQRRQSYDDYRDARGVVGGDEPAEQIIRRMRDGDPDRLALVDARAQLPTTVDQGLDLSGDAHHDQWKVLQRHYGELDDGAKAWLAGLLGEATRRGLTFHAATIRTVRVFELYRALISLCIAGADNDEVTRAILALVVGDIALYPGLELGHVVGSLGATEATRFADLVDAYTHDQLTAYTDDETGQLGFAGEFGFSTISPPPVA